MRLQLDLSDRMRTGPNGTSRKDMLQALQDTLNDRGIPHQIEWHGQLRTVLDPRFEVSFRDNQFAPRINVGWLAAQLKRSDTAIALSVAKVVDGSRTTGHIGTLLAVAQLDDRALTVVVSDPLKDGQRGFTRIVFEPDAEGRWTAAWPFDEASDNTIGVIEGFAVLSLK